MAISIKNQQDIEKMRVAGRLASEVLDFITPHVVHGITDCHREAETAKAHRG